MRRRLGSASWALVLGEVHRAREGNVGFLDALLVVGDAFEAAPRVLGETSSWDRRLGSSRPWDRSAAGSADHGMHCPPASASKRLNGCSQEIIRKRRG